MQWDMVIGIAVIAAFSIAVFYSTRAQWRRRDQRDRRTAVREGRAVSERVPDRREEALFKAMFPELQPHFHPEKAILFVRERKLRPMKSRGPGEEGYKWPAGFNTWWLVSSDVAASPARYELRNWRNRALASFLYEETREGAALHVGGGVLSVNTVDANPHVRYRHPQREFRWSAKKGWSFDAASSESQPGC